jgi:hypothetical protein
MFVDVVNEILRVCRASNDKDFKSDVQKLVNIKYFSLCKEFSVRDLRDKLTLDFTTATDSGLWLPSDLFGIDCARDTDGVEFIERGRADMEEDEDMYRYNRYKGSSDPLLSGEDINIEQDAASFTSATVDAYVAISGNTVKDQYIRIGVEPGYYKITNTATPYTISPTYRGPSQEDEEFRIRPEEDERMIIYDADEEILKDRSMDIHYWKAPKPLYRDSDFVLLPDAMALQLIVLRELPEAKALRPVSQGEIDDEKAKMKRLNPEFVRSGNPRDKHNNIFNFTATRKFFASRNE